MTAAINLLATGNFEVLEVYAQFNGPRLLAYKANSGEIFLALWVDEGNDFDLWLYMMVSLDRLQAIKTGQISLNDAFSHPESDCLYEAVLTCSDNTWRFKKLTLDEIDEACLPSRDVFLD
jgi:hypothetical protein